MFHNVIYDSQVQLGNIQGYRNPRLPAEAAMEHRAIAV